MPNHCLCRCPLFVCLSATYYIHIVEDIVKPLSRPGSPIDLVCRFLCSYPILRRTPFSGDDKYTRWEIAIFDRDHHLSRKRYDNALRWAQLIFNVQQQLSAYLVRCESLRWERRLCVNHRRQIAFSRSVGRVKLYRVYPSMLQMAYNPCPYLRSICISQKCLVSRYVPLVFLR